jgi:flavin-dependent dehydrogenase
VTEAWDAAVIGAGPAGSVAAGELARKGFSVVLVEKEHFPRDKACGEFFSAEAVAQIERLGLLEELRQEGAEPIGRGVFSFFDGRSTEFDLPEPGLGVSRRLLDDRIAREAARLGARVQFGKAVEEIRGGLENGFLLRLSGDSPEGTEIRARLVIAAWGRWSALDRLLRRPFVARSSGRFFGWKRHYQGDSESLAGRVRLFFFPGGYCGLSRVEKGVVNFAGLVSEAELRKRGVGWEGFTEELRHRHAALRDALAPLSASGQFVGTPTLFFEKRAPVVGEMLAAGDTAGVRDPFTGSGLASALVSGALAARRAEPFLRNEVSPGELLDSYTRGWRQSFARPYLWDTAFRAFLLSGRIPSPLVPVAPFVIRRAMSLSRAHHSWS